MERNDGLVQVAMLDKVSFPRLDVCRRVYSPDGIAPTIHTCGGGGTEPKIIVPERETEKTPVPAATVGTRSTYARRDWVLSPAGTAPCVMANWGMKSPPPLVGIKMSEGARE